MSSEVHRCSTIKWRFYLPYTFYLIDSNERIFIRYSSFNGQFDQNKPVSKWNSKWKGEWSIADNGFMYYSEYTQMRNFAMLYGSYVRRSEENIKYKHSVFQDVWTDWTCIKAYPRTLQAVILCTHTKLWKCVILSLRITLYSIVVHSTLHLSRNQSTYMFNLYIQTFSWYSLSFGFVKYL